MTWKNINKLVIEGHFFSSFILFSKKLFSFTYFQTKMSNAKSKKTKSLKRRKSFPATLEFFAIGEKLNRKFATNGLYFVLCHENTDEKM